MRSLRPAVARVLALAVSLLVVAAGIRHLRKSAATRAVRMQAYVVEPVMAPQLTALPRPTFVEEIPSPYGAVRVMAPSDFGLARSALGGRAFREPILNYVETGTDPAPASTDAPSTGGALEQYTPNQSDWSTMDAKVFAVGNTGQDPNGVFWLTAASWDNAKWDGTTTYNPSKMTQAAFFAAICPGVDQIRGIREVFYAHKPFADPKAPTKAEVDEWHRIALNHVRALVGYTAPERQAKKDHCMFARALWGQQRRFTTQWDAKYPGTVGSAYGPCQGSTNAHCGATFLPDAADQAPFLPAGHPPCTTQAGSEGVFSGPKSDIPWAIKWSRGLCNTLKAEGFWGGHIGPFFHRERFGYSFMDRGSGAVMRAKWTGALLPSLYCNPATAGCDPNTTGP